PRPAAGADSGGTRARPRPPEDRSGRGLAARRCGVSVAWWIARTRTLAASAGRSWEQVASLLEPRSGLCRRARGDRCGERGVGAPLVQSALVDGVRACAARQVGAPHGTGCDRVAEPLPAPATPLSGCPAAERRRRVDNLRGA